MLAKITDGLQEVKLRYLPFVNLGDNWQERAKTAYQRTLSYDLEHHGTSIGYQREDIVAEINDQPITATASQGQKRLIAIAIKLAPYFLITEEEKKPIVILDDGLSELDEKHRRKVLEFLTPLNQTFITVTQFNEPCATHYVINNNQSVTRKETI